MDAHRRGELALELVLAAEDSLSGRHGRIYAPFYRYGASRELRPTQYYLNKLPAAVFALLPELADSGAALDARGPSAPAVADDSLPTAVGVPWREPHGTPMASGQRAVEVDADIVERGQRGDVETERALVAALRRVEIEPLSPSSPSINYDVCWEHDGRLDVAEVKGLTARNEEAQLRRGVGQVIRYRRKLIDAHERLVAARLVCERSPADAAWGRACADAGVALIARPASDRASKSYCPTRPPETALELTRVTGRTGS